MTSHDDRADSLIDGAIDALARQEPPPGHVGRVLARTGRNVASGQSLGVAAAGYLQPRWVLPIAASILAVVAATWQSERQMQGLFEPLIVPDESPRQTSGASRWGQPEDLVRPVLPPQAYWGMDAFHEFATLRAGTRGLDAAAGHGRQVNDAQGRRSLAAGHQRRDDELSRVSEQAELPPIEVASIVPAPLIVPSVAALEEIALVEIPLAPIVIAPLNEEERP